MIQLENFNLDTALTKLPTYQSKTINTLIGLYGEEKTAEIWINSNGPKEISHNGGENQLVVKQPSYWNRLKDQFNMFLCGGTDYVDERKQAKAISEAGAAGLSTYLAQLISPIIGLSVPILVPAILLLLHLAAKMGIKAYCALYGFNGSN